MRSSLTADQFNAIREGLARRRLKEGEDKQVSYTRGSDNRLANFDNIADRSAGALTPGTVLYVYMSKHFDALSAWLLKGIAPSESLEDVVGDLMNYAELALGMYERDEAHVKAGWPPLEGPHISSSHCCGSPLDARGYCSVFGHVARTPTR